MFLFKIPELWLIFLLLGNCSGLFNVLVRSISRFCCAQAITLDASQKAVDANLLDQVVTKFNIDHSTLDIATFKFLTVLFHYIRPEF